MKTLENQRNMSYQAPEMEIMEVMVEQGFASSGNIETPGTDEEEGM